MLESFSEGELGGLLRSCFTDSPDTEGAQANVVRDVGGERLETTPHTSSGDVHVIERVHHVEEPHLRLKVANIRQLSRKTT